jgi:hypothetical protein
LALLSKVILNQNFSRASLVYTQQQQLQMEKKKGQPISLPFLFSLALSFGDFPPDISACLDI